MSDTDSRREKRNWMKWIWFLEDIARVLQNCKRLEKSFRSLTLDLDSSNHSVKEAATLIAKSKTFTFDLVQYKLVFLSLMHTADSHWRNPTGLLGGLYFYHFNTLHTLCAVCASPAGNNLMDSKWLIQHDDNILQLKFWTQGRYLLRSLYVSIHTLVPLFLSSIGCLIWWSCM